MKLFTSRGEAGERLYELLKKDPALLKNKKQIVIVSLLRGGIIVGDAIAKHFQVRHLPLVVTKIGAPRQEELAIGAVCFDVTYTQKEVLDQLGVDKQSLTTQIKKAQIKFGSYCKRFGITHKIYERLSDKTVIVVDDGIATGATVRAAYLFLKNKQPRSIVLAIPVAPADFEEKLFDNVLIYHKDPLFNAVSQYYEDFPEINDEEVRELLSD